MTAELTWTSPLHVADRIPSCESSPSTSLNAHRLPDRTMETVRRRFSSVFSGSRRPSDEYRRERGDPGPSSSFNRGVPPSAEDGPFRSRLNSGASSMERPRMSGQVGRLPEGVEFIRSVGRRGRKRHQAGR